MAQRWLSDPAGQGVTERLITGMEVTYWRTQYRETRAGLIPADPLTPSDPGQAVTIDWTIKYEF